MAKGKGSGSNYRSAGTGRFITSGAANRSPSKSLKETRGAGSAGGTYRSAISGRFVTTAHGKRSPGTTIKDN